MAKKAAPRPTLPPPPTPPTNKARITDYDQSFLSDTVKKLKVGQQATLTVSGEVTALEERYGNDPIDNMCAVELEPSAVKVSKVSSNMVSEVNEEKKKRGGGYYADEGDA